MRDLPDEKLRAKLRTLNPQWESGNIDPTIRAYARRPFFDLFFPLVNRLDRQRTVTLFGPRRVGKTVMLHQTAQALIDHGFDPKRIALIPVNDPLLSGCRLEELAALSAPLDTEGGDRVVMFDEIPYRHGWEGELATLADQMRGTTFIAAGSVIGAASIVDFHLPPLTFYEYIELRSLCFYDMGIDEANQTFLDYLTYGGFPESALDRTIHKEPARFVGHPIIERILHSDLPSRYGIGDTQELNRLFVHLAHRTGHELSYEGLSRHLGIAKNTLKRYLDYLEGAFLIRRISRIDENAKSFKRDNYFKAYLTTPSLHTPLFGLVAPDDPAPLDRLVETAVYSQFFHHPTLLHRLRYARLNGGASSIDMVLLGPDEKPDFTLAVEWSDRYATTDEELAPLLSFCHRHGLPAANVTTKTVEAERAADPAGAGAAVTCTPAADWCHAIGASAIENRLAEFTGGS